MKEQVIELAKQAGILWDTDIDRSEWLVRRSELENLVALVRNAALEEAAKELEQTKKETAGTWGIEWTVPKYPLQEHCIRAIRNLKEPTP